MLNVKQQKFITAFLWITLACLALSAVRYFYSGTIRHLYLPWNLFLALLPLVFAFASTQSKGVRAGIFALLWLAFLPNSFYIVTDFIHLNPIEANIEGYQVGNYRYANEANSPGILFDAVLIFMYAAYGFFAGLLSISLIHDKLIKKVKSRQAWALVIGAIALSSFAIYIGRVLRWNSWDILARPGQLLADVVDIFINPVQNSEAWAMSGLFFFATASFYLFYRSLLYLAKR